MPNRAGMNKTVFDYSKNLSKPRSKFKRPNSLATTFNAYDLIPLYVDEVLPGDTFKIDVKKFVRLSTPIAPTMDDLYLETFWFFVPNRLTWDHWEQFCGASDKAWVDTTQYTIPVITLNGASGVPSGQSVSHRTSLANYMLGNSNITQSASTSVDVNALPFRAYGLIYNYYFRDENLEDVIPVYTGDSQVNSRIDDTIGEDYFYTDGTYNYYFDCDNSCLKAAAFHDYFTSALPQPQKSLTDVLVPVGGYVSLQHQPTGMVSTPGFYTLSTAGVPTAISQISGSYGTLRTNSVSGSSSYVNSYIEAYSTGAGGTTQKNLLYNPAGTLGFNNLEITINNLRTAIIAQQWCELNARSGSRYSEYLLSHWSVNAGDARLQQPEYLGGSMTVLNMNQVLQTSETSTTPLGTTAGNSVTFGNDHEVFKSFVEHGIIMCIGVVRNKRTYSQGIDAMWYRETIFDYYDPLFANIGEQPIYKRELYAGGAGGADNEVFGYKEAWAEYKYKPNHVSGLFSPSVTGNLASWNYSENYVQAPSLSKSWLSNGIGNIDRTLVVAHGAAPQFLAQFAFDVETTRVMPRYNVPGLHRI